MAFRPKNRKAERGEIELLRGLVTLANQLQSSLELDAIVHVIATALSETFGFREASVYLVEPDGDTFRVHATVGENPEYDRELFDRPVPRRIWDELFQVKYQIGSSFFLDHREHAWTDEQLHYLPPLDLGERRADEWHQDDDLLVPLYDKQHELMGVLDLYDPLDRSVPTLDVVKSLEVFATHAAVAIENARQYQQLECARGQLEAQLALRHVLLDLSAALLSTLGERELFAQIAALLKEIIDYDAMEIRLVDEEARELYCGYASDEDVEQMSSWRAPLDVGVSGWVLLHNAAQLVNDMLNDPRGALVPGTDWVPQASIIAPLNVGGKVIGVLALDRMGGKTFHENELQSAELFANLAAIAIQNARHYAELQHTSKLLEGQLAIRHRLLNLSATLLGTLDQTTVFHEVTGMLKEMVDYDAIDIRLVDEESRELVCIYSRDENAEQMLSFRMSLDEGVSGWVARHNQAQLVNDMAHDPRVAQVPGTEKEEPQASIIVPLTVRGKVTGVLCLDRMDGRLFEEHELEPAMLFANLAAIAIQNARTYEETGAPGDQRRPHRAPQLPPLPRDSQGRGAARRALRRDVLPADDGPRPLQGGQRHHRPSEGRRSAARRQRRAARVFARVRLPGDVTAARSSRSSCRAPLWRRRGRSRSASAPRSRPSTSATMRSTSRYRSAWPPSPSRPWTATACWARPTPRC